MRSMPPSDLPLQRREFISAVAGTCLIGHRPAFASTAAPDAAPQPRRIARLETGWKFSLGHAADIERDFGFGRDQRTFAKAGAGTADAAMAKFDDRAWQSVRV